MDQIAEVLKELDADFEDVASKKAALREANEALAQARRRVEACEGALAVAFAHLREDRDRLKQTVDAVYAGD